MQSNNFDILIKIHPPKSGVLSPRSLHHHPWQHTYIFFGSEVKLLLTLRSTNQNRFYKICMSNVNKHTRFKAHVNTSVIWFEIDKNISCILYLNVRQHKIRCVTANDTFFIFFSNILDIVNSTKTKLIFVCLYYKS